MKICFGCFFKYVSIKYHLPSGKATIRERYPIPSAQQAHNNQIIETLPNGQSIFSCLYHQVLLLNIVKQLPRAKHGHRLKNGIYRYRPLSTTVNKCIGELRRCALKWSAAQHDVCEWIRVKHVGLINQWCASCMLKHTTETCQHCSLEVIVA